MTRPFEKALLPSLLLIITIGWASAAQAQQTGDTLVSALREARETGISETTLKPLLALGYEKQFEVSGMADLLPILAQCQRENLPLEPFLSKIAEGISKRIPASQIEQVLRKRLEDYRFTRSLITETAGLANKVEPVSPESHIRFTETLYCGLSRENLSHLLSTFSDTPLPVVSRGAEVLASLKQVHFDPVLAEQIVNTGMKQGYFTAEQREFTRIVAAAKRKGLQDNQIATAAMTVMGKGGSRHDFSLHLGITHQDLSRHGPQQGKDNPASGGQEASDGTGEPGRGTAADLMNVHGVVGPGSTPADPVTNSDSGETSDHAKTSADVPGPSVPNSAEVVDILDAGKGSNAVPDSGVSIRPEDVRGSDPFHGSGGAGSSSTGKGSNPVSSSGMSEGSTPPKSSDYAPTADTGQGSGTVESSGAGRDSTDVEFPRSPEKEQQKKERVIFAAAGMVIEMDPETLTLTLDLDKTCEVSAGCSNSFAISENVTVKAESSEVGLFDLGLDDIAVEGDYLRVLGKKQAHGTCLITHIVLCVDGAEGSGGGGAEPLDEMEPEKKRRVTFAAAGIVAAINPDGLALTLEIDEVNRSLEKQIGSGPFEFMISDDVKIKTESTEPQRFDLTLEDIVAGEQYVRVLGEKQTDGVYLINHIVVYEEE